MLRLHLTCTGSRLVIAYQIKPGSDATRYSIGWTGPNQGASSLAGLENHRPIAGSISIGRVQQDIVDGQWTATIGVFPGPQLSRSVWCP